MNLYTSLTLRYLKENKKRTIITIIGVILSTALVCGIGNIFESLMDFQIRETIKNKGSFHLVYNNVEQKKIKYIENNAEIEKVGLSSNLGHAFLNTSMDKMIQVKEYDKNAFEGYNIKLISGRLPQNGEEIVISESSLLGFESNIKINDIIELNVGNRVDESGNDIHGSSIYEGERIDNTVTRKYKVVGIIERPGFEYGYEVSTGITLLNPDKKNDFETVNVSCIVKNPNETYKNGPIIAQKAGIDTIKKDGEEYSDIWYNDHLLNLIGKSKYDHVSSTITSAVFLVTLLVILCTISTVYNAFSISIVERKKQFGVLSSIGATKNQIMNMVLTEGVVVSLIGIPIGLVCGTFAMDILFQFIQMYFKDTFIGEMGLRIVFSPKIIILSAMVVLITIFIAVMIPAISAAKISPLEAIRNTKDIKFKKVKSSKLVKLLFKSEGVLAYKNIKRNRKRYRSIVFSLVISILIFISFSGFMELMLKAEEIRNVQMNYNVWMSSTQDLKNDNNTKIIEELEKLDTVKNYAVYDIYNQYSLRFNISEDKINNKLKKDEINLLKSSLSSEKKYGKTFYEIYNSSINFPGDNFINSINLIDGSFNKEDAIKDNGVILINKSSYEAPGKRGEIELANYKVGDVISVELEDTDSGKTSTVDLKIMGITDEKLLGYGTYKYLGLDFIGYDELADKLGIELSKETIYIDSNEDEKTVSQLEKIARKYDWNFTDEIEESKSLQQSYIVMQIFVYGFIIVISLVSVTNIINTISTNINLRKRELAIIKSIGVTPQGFNRMIYLESILYGAISLLYGIPLGIGFTLLMNYIISNVISFGIIIPWFAIVISVIAVFIITFISAYIPMKKINNENIIESIRQESI